MPAIVVPGPSGLGVVPKLVRDPFGFCMSAAREGTGLTRIKAGPVAVYLVSDPDYVRRVLIDNAANYIKGAMMDGIRVALGNGLFTADGEAWLRQRRLMQPAFQAKHLMRETGQVIEDVLTGAHRGWAAAVDRGEPVDLLADTIAINTQIVLRTLMGVDGEHPELASLVNKVFVGMASRMWTFFLPAWLPTPGRAAYRRAIAQFNTKIREIITARRTEQPGNHNDLLATLLAARDGDGQPMSDTQLRDEIFTMFLAGNESTATSLTWTVCLLIQHPDVAAHLRTELDQAPGGRIASMEDLTQTPYLQKVIQEGFRLYPAFPMYFRTAVAADRLGPYEIPAGGRVVVSPYATHHDERYWENPESFDPDRFGPERFDAQARSAYYPFGVGKRRCVGEPMSLAIARMTLATLVHRYDMRLPDGPEVQGRYAMTYQPRHGLPVVLTPRTA